MTTKHYSTNVNSINSNNNNELTYNSNFQNFSSNTNASKGKKAIIGHLYKAKETIQGLTGTIIYDE